MPSVDYTWREFRRAEGDGLPNEPLNAPLPIGDPQSGPHHPTKKMIRDTLRPLEQAIPTVAGLASAAAASATAAAGYVQAAVSQGNVPIYPSAVAVHALTIPVGITLFRTTGCLTMGDGGGAYYAEVEDEPAHAAKTYDVTGRWFEITNDPVALGAWTPTAILTLNIPSDFPDLPTAIAKTANVNPSGGRIVLNIEAGHALTQGVLTMNANHGHYWIESEDAVVFLDDDFEGPSDVGLTSNDLADNLFVVYNGTGPTLNCLIDMGGRGATGYLGCWSANALIRPDAGVRNAGYCGLEWRSGVATAHRTVWDGSKQCGIRAAHTGSISAQQATADNCCQAVDVSGPSTGAVDCSRGGRIFFRQGSAINSGASGFNVRRASWLNAEQAEFSGAAAYGGIIEQGAHVSAYSMVIANTRNVTGPGYGLWLRGGYGTIAGSVVTGSAARHEGTRVADIRVGEAGAAAGVFIDATGIVTTDGTNRAWNIQGIDLYNATTRYGVLGNGDLPTPLNIGVFSATGGARGTEWSESNVLSMSNNTTAAGSAFQRFYNPNGAIGSITQTGSGISFNITSDGRLKVERRPIASDFDLDAIFGALEVISYDWLSALTQQPTGQRGYGLEAQAVQEHLPHLVTVGTGSPGDPDFVPWTLDLAGFMPFVLARLQQLASRQTAFDARLTALEAGA